MCSVSDYICVYSYSSIINKHISVLLTSCTLKFKSACHINVSAITCVLVSKLCSFTRTFFWSKEHFRICCTVLQVLLSHINASTGVLSSPYQICQDQSRQKSKTFIKKRSPHQPHHIGSDQHNARRGTAACMSL